MYFITKNKVKQNYMRGKKESTVQNEFETKETAIEKVKAEPVKEPVKGGIKEVAKEEVKTVVE